MLKDPLPHNQNMNARTMDFGSASGGHQNAPNVEGGHGCIHMTSAENVLMQEKDYGLSQPNLVKEPTPPKVPLHVENFVDKPEVTPHITKGVLKCSGHNPNAQASQHYSVVDELG